MKNLLSILFCATILLGINTAEANPPAARALMWALLNPVRANRALGAHREGNFIFNIQNQNLSKEDLEKKLEALMERDPLLANLAGNLAAKDTFPEHFAEDREDLDILEKLIARASGKEDPVLSRRLMEIEAADAEEFTRVMAELQRLHRNRISDAIEAPSIHTAMLKDGPERALEQRVAQIRKNLKWQEYLKEAE